MRHPYRYIGCFISPSSLEAAIAGLGVRLSKPIACPHITFAYMPKTVDTSLFGERVIFRAVGYGRDEENEGLLVEPLCVPARLKTLADEIDVPHITLSVSDSGEPVNTRYLQFTPIEPFELEGTFGGFTDKQAVVLHP